MSLRTELWEASKGSHVTGHVGFSVEDDEHVRIPYTMLASILQTAGLRRKISTQHSPRLSLHPADPEPVASNGPVSPPTGFRWMRPNECHGGDDYCIRCTPASPERRATPV